MKYLITLNGCHEWTYCELELNDKELEFLVKISKEINKCSDCECEPTISIWTGYKNLDGKRDFRTSGNWDYMTGKCEWEAIDLLQNGSDDNEKVNL